MHGPTSTIVYSVVHLAKPGMLWVRRAFSRTESVLLKAPQVFMEVFYGFLLVFHGRRTPVKSSSSLHKFMLYIQIV